MFVAIKVTYFSICLISEVWICSSKLTVLFLTGLWLAGALSVLIPSRGWPSGAQAEIVPSVHSSPGERGTATLSYSWGNWGSKGFSNGPNVTWQIRNEGGMRTQVCLPDSKFQVLSSTPEFFLALLVSTKLKQYGQDEGFTIGIWRYVTTHMCLAYNKPSGKNPFPPPFHGHQGIGSWL